MAAASIQNPKGNTAEEVTPLSFLFNANEMIVQCTSSCDDEDAAKELLKPVANKYRYGSNCLRCLL
jgi:hypothetical protein